MTFCKERMKWGKPRAQIPSRFLMEMRGETERAKKAAEASLQMFRNLAGPADAKATKPGKQPTPSARKPARRP
jgi:hypothetical protein